MKTDNKTMNKTEYAEMVRSSIDSRILSEAANHTFEKRRSPASTWAAAACFTLIFAAAAILLIKPMTERGQVSKVTASPEATKTAQTTPDSSFTPVPTPDISNMRIIYGSGDAYGIDDMEHEPGTVTLYGGLREMLADEQYNNCIFAVDIKMEYRGSFLDEHLERKSEQLDSLPAVILFNRLYEQFVEENRDRYPEFFNAYYAPDIDEGDDSTDPEVIEELVFKSAFVDYLYSSGQMAIYQDYEKAREEFGEASQTLWADKRDGEVQRLKDLGYRVSLTSDYLGEMQLFGLLTRDQLKNFPASPEFAYIITPALNPEETPATTPLPSNPIGSGCDPYCMEDWDYLYGYFETADENGVKNGEKCFKNYDPSMTAYWGTERGSNKDSWLSWKAIGTYEPNELYLTDIYLAGSEDAPLELSYLALSGTMLESFICENVTFSQIYISQDTTLRYVHGIHSVYTATLKAKYPLDYLDMSSDSHCLFEMDASAHLQSPAPFTVDLTSEGGGSVGIRGGMDNARFAVSVYAVPADGHSFVGWYYASGELISTNEILELPNDDGNIRDFYASARFEAQPSLYAAQVENIINLLAEYHAAQFTRSAQIGELKLSENVLSDLEERQRCIDEMEQRIGKLNGASASVERLGVLPTYAANGEIKSYIVSYYERTAVDHSSVYGSGGGSVYFDTYHTVTIAADGTVLHDYFSEEQTTGFSNHPFLGNGIVWTDSEVPMSYYASERYRYLAAANELLAGEIPERTGFHYGDEQYVRFRFDGDALKAYVTVNTMITAPGSPHTDEGMDVTVAMIPREVGELAYQKLYEYWGKYVSFSEMECDLTQEFDGFVGENWFALVTPDDSMHDLQVHCIFCFDGSEWHEIIGNNGGVYINGEGTPFPHTIFGACVLDEDTAIICYYTKWFFTDGSDDGKLYIYRTENGGESWSRLDIVLPDFYNDMSYYAPLTPIFDESGMHGVIILDSGITAYGNKPFSWLESHDGGQSWNYRNTEITP